MTTVNWSRFARAVVVGSVVRNANEKLKYGMLNSSIGVDVPICMNVEPLFVMSAMREPSDGVKPA